MEIAGYVASVLIGLSLGLIGGGGSILSVPILVYFFAIDPLLATTYSLFVVGLTSTAGAVSHYLKGNVDVKTAFIFGLPSLAAVFIMRRWVMPVIPVHLFTFGHWTVTKSMLLMLVFAGLMLAASLSMIRKKKGSQIASSKVNYRRLILQAIVVGLITGFVGVGGGFLIIPSLVLFAGLPMKKAVGTSLMVMTISSLLGVLGDITGHVVINYTFLAIFSGFAIAGIILGSYLTRFISDTRLKPAFGWFVLAMGIFVLISTLTNSHGHH
ncbi:sulfite exporter TauE/SafE family protein [Mucilaginibacter achroorhodeus]|uniref:Probable membrane transporter protein n=1 Tax=Mucilaginibacter achroorhodeus TaxID=2599294 RepID=A0A563UB04_9SPHI|nr:sulfite exporter TauE/SafE family protein [Mucilaginibacter achroorhodeus]TWR28567.1 sulfite exporter TauE/SafE family protein [Mucilaginibacter achroorhodeus]